MEKMNILLKLSFKFATKYFASYIRALVKPALAVILGIIIFCLCVFSYKQYALLGLLSLPFLFYGFWRGFLVAYALNLAAVSFLKNNCLAFKDYFSIIKNESTKIAKWVSFCALVTVVSYIPATVFSIAKESVEAAIITFFITTLLLSPFLNYFTQAFFFRREGENYFDLFLNCYKKLDKTGTIIAVTITLISLFASLSSFFTAFFVFISIYIYSINAFWYSSRN